VRKTPGTPVAKKTPGALTVKKIAGALAATKGAGVAGRVAGAVGRVARAANPLGAAALAAEGAKYAYADMKANPKTGTYPTGKTGRNKVRGGTPPVPPTAKKTTAEKAPATPTAKTPAVAPSDKPTKIVKTKGGDYPVYKKSSATAGNFRSAFAAARKAGKSEFTWQGRRYNTKTK